MLNLALDLVLTLALVVVLNLALVRMNCYDCCCVGSCVGCCGKYVEDDEDDDRGWGCVGGKRGCYC